jgi:hypothetical protein
VSEYLRGDSEHVRVGVGVSMSKLEWERVCQSCQSEHASCGSELVGVVKVGVYACQSSK